LVARFGFEELNLNRIEIIVATGNIPSQGVAMKVGASREGRLRKRLVVRDHVYDAIIFSLIPEDLNLKNSE
jgi:ribosomal-protein-serine acetyltransferase